MSASLPTNHKLHFASIRKKGEPKQHYICLGEPIFKNPTKQNKDVRNKKFVFEEIFIFEKDDRLLQDMMQQHIDSFDAVSIVSTSQPSPTETPPPPTPAGTSSPAPYITQPPVTVETPTKPPPPTLAETPPLSSAETPRAKTTTPIALAPTTGEPITTSTATATAAELSLAPTQTVSPVNAAVHFALGLNFDDRPRLDRHGLHQIKLHNKKQAGELHRVMAMFTAKRWGCDNPALTYSTRQQIFEAACKLTAYDYGFKKPFATKQIPKWEEKLHSAIDCGVHASSTFANPLAPTHKGSVSYTDALDEENPGYIRTLFRYAQKVKGVLATFGELAETMNEKSRTNDNKPNTDLTRRQLNSWFKKEGGKETAPTTKPLDTPDHIKKRNAWVRDYFTLLTDVNAAVTYLDEKWFYTTNRRRRMKKLPKGNDEEEGIDFVPQPKVRSRRFPVNSMFMTVVGRPVKEKNSTAEFI